MADHTRLKSVNHCADSLLSDQLETNITGFLQWSLLGVGAFDTVRLADSGCYGGDQSSLRLVDDPSYTDGQVWEGFRRDWVWESGIEFTSQPIRVSGVYVNNSFLPLASGVTVDYPNGRVVLDTPASGTVRCEYSYRLFQIHSANHPAWRRVQPDSFRVDDPQFHLQGSGAWDVLAQNRVQLPAIFVEAIPQVTREGAYVGNQTQKVRQEVHFHVLSESDDRFHAMWAHDALTYQEEKTFYGFDKNRMLTDDAFPLDYTGEPKASGLMYPDLVRPSGEGGYQWAKIRVAKTRSSPGGVLGNLNYVIPRWTTEVWVN